MQEEGTSEENPASLLPVGTTALRATNMAAMLFLKTFSTSLFKDCIMKTDFEIYAHAKFSQQPVCLKVLKTPRLRALQKNAIPICSIRREVYLVLKSVPKVSSLGLGTRIQ